jgi:hypothetical protein
MHYEKLEVSLALRLVRVEKITVSQKLETRRKGFGIWNRKRARWFKL